MDRVFLAVSVNGIVYTLNAFRPAKRNVVLFPWSFFASWITIELAWFHLLWQIAITAWFTYKGALRSRTGRFALVLMLANFVGLGLIIWRSLGTRRLVQDAFKDWEPPAAERRDLGVRRTRNITYHEVDGRKLKLDVYAPAAPAAPGERRPAVIQIHGGGWVIGDKREQGLPLLKHLARQGWVGFNVNYRLSPKATFPDHLIDLKHAVAFIRAHADEYGIDPHFIAVTGGSAGGHLTALMGLTANDPAYQPGFEDADTALQAAVPFYGVYDFTNRKGYYPPNVVPKFLGPVVLKADLEREPEKFAAASPIDQIHADAPPFFVIHGDLDTLAPVEGARDFVHDLRERSNAPVVYLELKGAQHAFEIFPSLRANEVVDAVGRYLNTLHAEYLKGHAPGDVSAEKLAAATEAAAGEPVTA